MRATGLMHVFKCILLLSVYLSIFNVFPQQFQDP